jgi:hypothetical protein
MAILRRNSGRLGQLIAAIVFSGLSLVTRAQPLAPLREPEIKAATLYNIIAFTDWPATSFASPDAPLIVGVLGVGPVATLLFDLVNNETWHGRPMVVRRCASAAEALECHAIFVAKSEHSRWRAMSSQFSQRPILTVADAENFARQGGVVQLTIDRNKLRLLVNLRAARASGLVISSKVLRLAEVIDERGP